MGGCSISSITVGALWVKGGGLFSAFLANELIQTMTEVLDLACPQEAADPHQLSIMGVLVDPSRVRLAPCS